MTEAGGSTSEGLDPTAGDELRSFRARQAAILRRSHDLTMFFERDGTIAWISPNCADLFGAGPETFVGINGLQTIDERDRDRVINEFLGMLNLGESVRTRFRITDATGVLRWVEEIATNLLDDPDVGYIVGNLRDVTEQHVAECALAASETRHRSMLETAQEGIWVTNPAGHTVFANPHLATILGIAVEELGARPLLDFVGPEERPVVAANDAMSGRGEVRRYETRFIRPDGSARWVIVSSAPLCDTRDGADEDGPEMAPDILHMVTDISMRKRDEAELLRITLHDGLTGLPNRRLFADRLAHHLDQGAGRGTAVLVLNVDRFKDVNDALGHSSADAVLSEIAQRLRRSSRSRDTVARAGGDEFLILVEDVHDIEAASAIADGALSAVRAPLRIDGTDIEVTASIGIAMNPLGDAEELMRGAGVAMYRAKASGRDCVAVFDPDNDHEAAARRILQADLRRAITNHEFEVWYQPIVGLDDAEVRGVEALVRWRHPTRGLLLPGAFMGVAESTGLIRDIGYGVLKTACRDAAAWMDPDHAVRVSVNIAAAQVVDVRLGAKVADVLTNEGLDPELLTLEITESAAMGDPVVAEHNLNDLRELGVRLALDDFGTGYSSLSFLRRLPVTVVKIDQSFVAGLGERREDELIVAGVISMAQALGHTVIAEGIETTRQRDALRRMGCRYGQGFLWSRAVPCSELAATIEAIEESRDEYRFATDLRAPLAAGPGPSLARGRTGAELGAAAFDALPTAAAVLDRSGVIIATNRAWRLFATMNQGSSSSTGVGVDYLAVCERAASIAGAAGRDGAAVVTGLRKVLAGERRQFQIGYSCPSPLQDRSFLMQAVRNGESGLVVTHTDVSALKQLEHRFGQLGYGDALTGLPDETLLESIIDRMRNDAELAGEPMGILCCDLTGLEEVGFTLGHAARDDLLAQVVARIARIVRDGDLVARAGDGQLVIACTSLTTRGADAGQVARRIEAVIALPFQLGTHRVSITATVGFTTDDGRLPVAMLLRAARSTGDLAAVPVH